MSPATHPRRAVMATALLAGWAVMWVGVRAARHDAADAHPVAIAVHLVAFDLAHDLVLAPLFVLGGWLIARLVPAPARGPLRASLAATVVTVVFALPLVRRWGERPANPSALPQDYGRNLVVLVVLVWVCGCATVILRVRRGRRSDGLAGPEPAGP